MRSEYTIRAKVIYEICIMADDEDEALELALQYKFTDWEEIDAEFFIKDIVPVQLRAPRDAND